MIALSSSFFQFHCHPELGLWSLQGTLGTDPVGIENSGLRISYRKRGQLYQSYSQDWKLQGGFASLERVPSLHGPIQLEGLAGQVDAAGLRLEIQFGLALDHPLFLWKVKIINEGSETVYLEQIELLRAGLEVGSGPKIPGPAARRAFFSNGWQSWSTSRAYGPEDRMADSRLGWLEGAMWYNPATPRPNDPGHFGADFFGVIGNRETRRGLLAGFLAQKQHFGSLEARLGPDPVLRMWASGDGARLDPATNIETDWAACVPVDFSEPDPLAAYWMAVVRENRVGPAGPATVGWCSWYQFYNRVTAEQIRDNLQSINQMQARLPLELVQIDDGFESQVGDWLRFRLTFPAGVAPLAREIQAAGRRAGLWLAPFILHPRAKIIREHPDWVLRAANGRRVSAGFAWDAFTTALDPTHPGARDYIGRVIDTAVHEWGFPYLKLDFLYAGALQGAHYNPKLTRAQVLRLALENVREAAGAETTLLGCGVPLGSALGLFQAMRIGEDVSGDWEPNYYKIRFFFNREPNLPSARNALQNILTRAPMHRRWWINDPDCLLVRPDCNLTLAEVQTLATAIALTGGTLLLSDHLPGLPEERIRLAASLLPPLDRTAQVPDWFDSARPERLRLDLSGPAGDWTLIAAFNWQDRTQSVSLDLNKYGLPVETEYMARSFWTGDVFPIQAGKTSAQTIPAHGVVLLAVRKILPGQAQYLGGGLHISQGLEVSKWEPGSAELSIGFDLRRRAAQGPVVLSLPQPLRPREAYVNGEAIPWTTPSTGIYHFQLAFDKAAELTIATERS